MIGKYTNYCNGLFSFFATIINRKKLIFDEFSAKKGVVVGAVENLILKDFIINGL